MNVVEIGAGILLASASDGEAIPRQFEHKGILHNRFMDRLFLPCRTDELSVEQLKVINRFREASFKVDAQFDLNISVKQRVGRAIDTVNARSVLEIGCGRFPILNYLSGIGRYLCIEVDEDAVTTNCADGIKCLTLDSVLSDSLHADFDVFVALFVCQFNIQDSLVKALYDRTHSRGLGIINLHGVNPELRNRRLQQFEVHGFSATPVPDVHPSMRKNEFYVFSKISNMMQSVNDVARIRKSLQTLI